MLRLSSPPDALLSPPTAAAIAPALERESIAGFAVCREPLPKLVDAMDAAALERHCTRVVAFLNPHSAVVAREDAPFDRALHEADWIVADGVGIVLASKLTGGRIRDRITGSDVFRAFNARLAARGGSAFLFGSTDDNLAEMARRMARDFPGLRVAGTLSPPFRAEYTAAETDAMLAAINAAKPDVLWVGMTAPKQEKWIHAHLDRLDVGVAAGIGAVFDFYTGRVKRSHPVFQKLGLEWLPRLLQQPKRLWRRTFVSAPLFLAYLLIERRAGR